MTGATGFIGSALCRELRHRGFRVRALVRSKARAAALAALDIQLIEGDLDSAAVLQQLVTGCAAVIHAAGVVRGSCRQDFDRVNVQGCAGVLEATVQRAPAARLLLVSSLAAREPQLSWYAASKRAGEDLVTARSDLDWVVVRPPAVYGPGDREMLPVFQWMSRGIALVPGSPGSRISLIHVHDLVASLIACLTGNTARHGVFTPCDGKQGGYDWHEMAALAAATWHRRVRIWKVPAPLLDGVARINLLAARLTGGAPMLTPSKLRELRHPDWVVDNASIHEATGWEPEIDLARGMEALRKAEL